MSLDSTLGRGVLLLQAFHRQLDSLELSIKKAWTSVTKIPFPNIEKHPEDLIEFRTSVFLFFL